MEVLGMFRALDQPRDGFHEHLVSAELVSRASPVKLRVWQLGWTGRVKGEPVPRPVGSPQRGSNMGEIISLKMFNEHGYRLAQFENLQSLEQIKARLLSEFPNLPSCIRAFSLLDWSLVFGFWFDRGIS
jgi:hypothetical protein